MVEHPSLKMLEKKFEGYKTDKELREHALNLQELLLREVKNHLILEQSVSDLEAKVASLKQEVADLKQQLEDLKGFASAEDETLQKEKALLDFLLKRFGKA